MWRYARRRVHSDEAADDICAEVFEIALRKMPREHPHPIGWLIRAASIVISEAARRERRSRTAATEHAVVSHNDGPDERLPELDVAWAAISSSQREVLQLIIWDEVTAADAAVILGCSEQAVWKRVSRARQALRDAWPKPFPESAVEVNHVHRPASAL